MKFLPIDEGNVEDLTKVKESIGLVGLKYFEWGVDESLSLDELKANYSQAIEEEMTVLLSIKKARRNRRASVLPASGRPLPRIVCPSSARTDQQLFPS